ncbi:MoaD/ThiS family protein [Candidatus Aerophobetes bacterium]|nr:MoaD/ThiS family protein [Candidatus Aerophobetes bacterium]
MKVKVKFSTIFRELSGVDKTEFSFPQSATVGDTLKKIVEDFPRLKKWIPQNGEVSDYVYVLLNGKYAPSQTQLKNDDEIVLFPPVAGG